MRRSILQLLLLMLLTGITFGEESEWHWQSTRLPQAKLIEGLWTEQFRLTEAVHHAGMPYQRMYSARNAYWRPNAQLINLSNDPAAWSRFSVVVLSNVDAITLGQARIEKLQKFVSQGGGLIVLGGYWAYSRGAYRGTALEQMLPVTLPDARRIDEYKEGLSLRPGPSATWNLSYDFEADPRALYVQTIVPKLGTVVQVTAGDQPGIVSGTFGKGRVVAVALTANGVVPKNGTIYWDWQDWTALLAQTLQWAAGSRPLKQSRRIKSASDKESELDDLLFEPQSVTDAMVREHLQQIDASSAASWLDVFIARPTMGTTLQMQLCRALSPHAQPQWVSRLTSLLGSRNPNPDHRAAAVVLVGASRADRSYEMVLQAFRRESTNEAAIEAFGLLGDQRAVQLIRDHLTQTGKVTPEMFAESAGRTLGNAALSLYRLGAEDGVQIAIDAYTRTRLMRRIYVNAGKRRVLNTDPIGIKKREDIRSRAGELRQLERELLAASGPVPESQRDAIVTMGMNVTEPDAVRWLLQALEKSIEADPTAKWWAPLTSAQDGIIAAWARAASSE